MARPLVIYRLRVFVDSYVIFAIAKRAEEERPWAIIMKVAPKNPIIENERAPAISSPIWPIDEYAISAFRSVCRKQIIDEMIAPHRAILIIKEGRVELGGVNIVDIWSRPYPPNFNKIAAKIMEPATGASTCALGSHKCVKNSGSLTINARFVINHQTIIMFSLIDGKSQGRNM